MAKGYHRHPIEHSINRKKGFRKKKKGEKIIWSKFGGGLRYTPIKGYKLWASTIHGPESRSYEAEAKREYRNVKRKKGRFFDFENGRYSENGYNYQVYVKGRKM